MPSARFSANSVVFFTNVSGAQSSSFAEMEGGTYQLFAEGSFVGSVLTLDGQGPNDGTIAGVLGVAITAPTAGSAEIRCARGERLRATLTGGAPVGIYFRAVKVSD